MCKKNICPKIKSNGTISYGGNQSWFPRNSAYKGGCGPVSGANVLASLAYQYPHINRALSLPFKNDNTLIQSDYFVIMEELYRKMLVVEIPVLNKIYDNLSRRDKIFSKLPINLGIGTCRFTAGLLRYGLEKKIFLKHFSLSTMFCSYEKGLNFIRFALEKNLPISLLTTNSSYSFTLYDTETLDNGSSRKMHKHFVTITGIVEPTDCTSPELIISTWGKPGRISYDILYHSWQSPLSFGSAMIFFTPTKQKSTTYLSLLKSFTILLSI